MKEKKIISKLTGIALFCIILLEVSINYYTYACIKNLLPIQDVKTIIICNSTVGVCIFALLCILNYEVLSPLKYIRREMDKLTAGERTLAKIKTSNDEIGGIYTALKELNVSLSIKDYEWNCIIDSYYRFVPRGINKLLNRASIMETDLLDMVNLDGNVSILCVSNLDNLRFEMDDTDFMKYINNLFALIYNKIEQSESILLTEDYNLSALKIYNRGNDGSGIRFGLSIFGEIKDYFETNIPSISIILHNTGFLYGVAGTKDAAFPFLSSSEMAFLSSFNEDFVNIKTKMVVTEQYLKNSNCDITTRYIGFLSSEGSSKEYKVYEVLDVYSDIQKSEKVRLNKDFQRGIQLFYENKFYQARNVFSKVIKNCDDDYVAKWYLFACESYLNDFDSENVRYCLFAVK